MKDKMSIGSVPSDEGSDSNYGKDNARRYEVMMKELTKDFMPPRCRIQYEPVSYGGGISYGDVFVHYDDEVIEEAYFAYFVERNLPLEWVWTAGQVHSLYCKWIKERLTREWEAKNQITFADIHKKADADEFYRQIYPTVDDLDEVDRRQVELFPEDKDVILQDLAVDRIREHPNVVSFCQLRGLNSAYLNWEQLRLLINTPVLGGQIVEAQLEEVGWEFKSGKASINISAQMPPAPEQPKKRFTVDPTTYVVIEIE